MQQRNRFSVGKVIRNAAVFSKKWTMAVLPGMLRRNVPAFILGLMIVLTMIACNRDPGIAGGTTETTSANICGTMFNDDGTRAKDATVRFVPADFDAYSAEGTTPIESTQTDSDGRYAFMLEASGYYNVYAQKNEANAFEDSVYVSTDDKARVDDTLKAPGSVSGTARLEPGDDNRQIVILVLGTNTYAVPEDTSGTFLIPGLAEGDYVLRFLTIIPDYGYTDMVISVQSGQNTTIGQEVRLVYKGVPDVGPVAMSYDSGMMYATLSWPAADTSKVAGFYIYENPSYSVKPLAVVNNTDTMFRADAILFSGFAFPVSYSVAAVGNDRRVGRLSTTSSFYAQNMLIPLDTIICEPKSKYSVATVRLVKGNPAVVLGGPGWLASYDTAGVRVREYVNADHYGITAVDGNIRYAPVAYSQIAADSSGNVFAIETYKTGSKTTDSATLTLFTPDLEPVATVAVGWRRDTTDEKTFPFKVTADGDGHVHLLYRWNDGSSTGKTVVTTYDATLDETGTDTIPECCLYPDFQNDTVYMAGSSTDPDRIVGYDIKGNIIDDRNMASMKTGVYTLPPPDTVQKVFRFSSGAMLVCVEARGVVMTDPDFNLTGRCRINIHADIIGTDGIDRIYVSDNSMNAMTPAATTNIIVYKVR